MEPAPTAGGGSDSGMEPTPDSSLCSVDGASENGSESSAGSRRRSALTRPPRNPALVSRSVSVRSQSSLRSPQGDGRWPSNNRSIMSVSIGGTIPDKRSRDSDSSARRRRKSAENLAKGRDASLNRTASLRKKMAEEAKLSATPTSKTPKSRPSTARTKIYQETASQTGLTGEDIQAATQHRVPDPASRVELANVAVQVEGWTDELEKLGKEKKDLEEKTKRLTEDLEKVREERHLQDKRIREILRLGEGENIPDFIETDKKKTNEIVRKQQLEINQLHTLCCNLKKEMERRMETERRLLEEQREAEAESLEIQEFLQAEKLTMGATLEELEAELTKSKLSLSSVSVELARQQEESSHLVRMCEQTRQEKLSVESRLRSLELRNKESMLMEGAAVSGAAVALSGLGSRLEVLVSSLVSAYDISPADLEDVVYHNEAFNESESSGDISPEVEVKKGGLLAAIMSAIHSATHRSKPVAKEKETTTQETEIIAQESEPTICDKISSSPCDLSPLKSQGVSIDASDDFDLSVSEGDLSTSESLQNLSDAILKRQRTEEESLMLDDLDPQPQSGLVDQVLEVDNLVTKLLRVLHIIEASRNSTRTNGDRELANSVNETIEILKAEVKDLRNKLNNSEKSAQQVDSLQKELREKEGYLAEIEKKYELAKELLTNNYHKAMSEVRRLYEAIDNARQLLDDAEDDLGNHEVLIKIKRGLEDSNFQCSTTLPISTSRPDLNANPPVPLNVP